MRSFIRRYWIPVVIVVLVCLSGTSESRKIARKLGVEKYIPTTAVMEDPYIRETGEEAFDALKSGDPALAVEKVKSAVSYWLGSFTSKRSTPQDLDEAIELFKEKVNESIEQNKHSLKKHGISWEEPEDSSDSDWE